VIDHTVFSHEGMFILENHFTNKSFAAVCEALCFVHLNKEAPVDNNIRISEKNLGKQGLFVSGNMLGLWQF